MKAGNILLKKLTGYIIAAVFFAGCLCMGFAAEAGYLNASVASGIMIYEVVRNRK